LWEAEREAEAERLRNEAALLQQAWQKYEEQLRRLLAEKELVRRGVPPAKRVPVLPSGAPAPAGAPAVHSLDPDSSCAEEKSAWLQFQRMRREIQSRSRFKN
jgi:hypothetical protein